MNRKAHVILGVFAILLPAVGALCWWSHLKEEHAKWPGKQMRNAARLGFTLWEFHEARGVYPQQLSDLVAEKFLSAEEFEALKFRATVNAAAEDWLYRIPTDPIDDAIISPRMADPGGEHPQQWIIARADGSAERFGPEKAYRLRPRNRR